MPAYNCWMKRARSATSTQGVRPLPLGLPTLLAALLLASAGLGLATGDVELAAVLVAGGAAAALVAFGVWNVRVLPVCAGAGLFAAALLVVGLSSEVDWETEQVLTFAVEVIDVDSRDPIENAEVCVKRPEVSFDTPLLHTDAEGRAIASVVVLIEGRGPLYRQLTEPEPKPDLSNHVLAVSAPGYATYLRPLAEQLPDAERAMPGADTPTVTIGLSRR